MKFVIESNDRNSLKLNLNIRIRNKSRINKFYDLGIDLPDPKAFNSISHTLDLSFYDDISKGLIDKKKLDEVVIRYRSHICLLYTSDAADE